MAIRASETRTHTNTKLRTATKGKMRELRTLKMITTPTQYNQQAQASVNRPDRKEIKNKQRRVDIDVYM